MPSRLECESKCDELFQSRARSIAEWGEAKVAFDNIKDVEHDMLAAIVNEIQMEAVLREGGEYTETKAKRLARSHPKWKDYRAGLTAAKQREFELRMQSGNLKKEYDLYYAKYLKS